MGGIKNHGSANCCSSSSCYHTTYKNNFKPRIQKFRVYYFGWSLKIKPFFCNIRFLISVFPIHLYIPWKTFTSNRRLMDQKFKIGSDYGFLIFCVKLEALVFGKSIIQTLKRWSIRKFLKNGTGGHGIRVLY